MEGKNVMFPGRTMASKICLPSTSSFEAPRQQLGVYLVLDVWEAEQQEEEEAEQEEPSSAAFSHRTKRKRLEQNCSTHRLSNELKHSKRTTKRSNKNHKRFSRKHNHCNCCLGAEEKRPERSKLLHQQRRPTARPKRARGRRVRDTAFSEVKRRKTRPGRASQSPQKLSAPPWSKKHSKYFSCKFDMMSLF